MTDPSARKISTIIPMKPGDRARLCPHIEALIQQDLPVPGVWLKRTPRNSWAIVCKDCADAARAQLISLDEQITRAKQ